MSHGPDRIRVAVVGQFSSGKSALINALLGEEIAPMGVTPVTAVLHRFRWSNEREAIVENLDGTTTSRSPESLIESPLSEGQLSQARQVHIGLPSGALRDIEIWDTPGFGSNALAHELVARRALIDADIVVWVTPIDHALDRGEAEKLTRLCHKVTPVLLVVNKSDLADDDERDEAVAAIESDAGELATAVVWVSALQGLQAIREGRSSSRKQFGFDKLEPKLAELASDALRARRDAGVRSGAGVALGANEVRCPDCKTVGRFDDRFCVCGRSLEDQHRPCPRCETDNTVQRPRCRGCNLVFEDWERAEDLKARAEQEIELGLLVDASATLTLAMEALPDDDDIYCRRGAIERAQQKVEALIRAASRQGTSERFCGEVRDAVTVLHGVGAGMEPFWALVRSTALDWVGAHNERPGDALEVLEMLVEAGAGTPEVLTAREVPQQRINAAKSLVEKARREIELGQLDDAVESLESALAASPSDADARRRLSEVKRAGHRVTALLNSAARKQRGHTFSAELRKAVKVLDKVGARDRRYSFGTQVESIALAWLDEHAIPPSERMLVLDLLNEEGINTPEVTKARLACSQKLSREEQTRVHSREQVHEADAWEEELEEARGAGSGWDPVPGLSNRFLSELEEKRADRTRSKITTRPIGQERRNRRHQESSRARPAHSGNMDEIGRLRTNIEKLTKKLTGRGINWSLGRYRVDDGATEADLLAAESHLRSVLGRERLRKRIRSLTKRLADEGVSYSPGRHRTDDGATEADLLAAESDMRRALAAGTMRVSTSSAAISSQRRKARQTQSSRCPKCSSREVSPVTNLTARDGEIVDALIYPEYLLRLAVALAFFVGFFPVGIYLLHKLYQDWTGLKEVPCGWNRCAKCGNEWA